MTTDRQRQVVTEARGWIGTPYVHQAMRKGAGSDCLGLLRGVWIAVLGAEPAPVPAYTADWSEASGREDLIMAARQWLCERPVDMASPGDVLLFRMRDGAVAKHLGIQSEVGPRQRFVHAYCGHGVLESPLSEPWRRRIAARFAFPEGVF